MNIERIKEIQQGTDYPDSISVQQALLKVWNECEQEKVVNKNDFLLDVSISNLMQEATSKLINDIHEKRNKIITERLKEIVGIDLDIKAEANRRFKRLAIELNGDEETIYFNDGSEQGKRIVTFVKKDNPLTFETSQMSVEYSYY